MSERGGIRTHTSQGLNLMPATYWATRSNRVRAYRRFRHPEEVEPILKRLCFKIRVSKEWPEKHDGLLLENSKLELLG